MPKKRSRLTKEDQAERRKYKRKLFKVKQLLIKAQGQDEIEPPMTEALDGPEHQPPSNNEDLAKAVREIEHLLEDHVLGRDNDDASDEASSDSEDDQPSQSGDQSAANSNRKRSRDPDLSRDNSDADVVGAEFDDNEELSELAVVCLARPNLGAKKKVRFISPRMPSRPDDAERSNPDLCLPGTSRDVQISVPVQHLSLADMRVEVDTTMASDNDDPAVITLNTSHETDNGAAMSDDEGEYEDDDIVIGNSYESVRAKIITSFLEQIRQQECDSESDEDEALEFNYEAPETEGEEDSANELNESDLGLDGNDNVQGDVNEQGQACKLSYKGFLEYFRREKLLPDENARQCSYTELFAEVSRKSYINTGAERLMFDLHRARDKAYRNEKRFSLDCAKKRWLGIKPKVKMTYEFKEIATGKVFKEVGLLKFPRKKYPADKFIKVSEYAKCHLNDLFMHCQKLHGRMDFGQPANGWELVDFFMDGVPLAKSSPEKLDVVNIRFTQCRLIYIYGMHMYRKDAQLTANQILDKFCEEANFFDFTINRVIADAPMRAKLKCLKTHAGYFSCENCFAKGEQAERSQKVVWPAAKMKADERTDLWWNRMMDKIEENGGIENMDEEELLGLTGVSPLSKMRSGSTMRFPMSKRFTVEPMHNIGGCIKQLIRLMFQLSKKTAKLSAEQTRKLRLVDARWTKIKLPREFNRRNREITRNYMHLKSQEYFSLCGAGFLAIADAMDLEDDRLRKEVWLRFAYIVRLTMFPNKMWENFKVKVPIWIKIWTFYKLFEEVYTKDECSWNIHTFSHIIHLRNISNLPDGSALLFEGAFNYMKKWMKPNTPSFAKQVMMKMAEMNVKQHDCKPVVRMSAKEKPRYGDNMIFTEDGDFYKIISVESDHYRAQKFLTSRFVTEVAPSLNWDIVGVKLVHQLKSDIHEVPKSKVVGKATIDDKVIIAMPFAFAFV